MNKDWKKKIWKYATSVFVVILFLNPEFAELALFIDAIGLETFFMLIEVQILLIFSIFHEKAKRIIVYLKNLMAPTISWQDFKQESKTIFLLAPGPAVLMHVLVLSFIIDSVIKL